MASLNLPKLLLNLTILSLTCCNAYTTHKTTTSFKLSTIAAEPSVLPYSPLSSISPELSPDITPLFPTTPSSASNSPSSESSVPIIPSSPSPPNPDSLSTPNTDSSLPSSMSPSSSMIPESSAFATKLSVLLNSAMVILVFIAFW